MRPFILRVGKTKQSTLSVQGTACPSARELPRRIVPRHRSHLARKCGSPCPPASSHDGFHNGSYFPLFHFVKFFLCFFLRVLPSSDVVSLSSSSFLKTWLSCFAVARSQACSTLTGAACCESASIHPHVPSSGAFGASAPPPEQQGLLK